MGLFVFIVDISCQKIVCTFVVCSAIVLCECRRVPPMVQTPRNTVCFVLQLLKEAINCINISFICSVHVLIGWYRLVGLSHNSRCLPSRTRGLFCFQVRSEHEVAKQRDCFVSDKPGRTYWDEIWRLVLESFTDRTWSQSALGKRKR